MNFKALLALTFVLFLIGCAGLPAPRGTETLSLQIAGEVFVARDGIRLPVSRWEASGRPHAIIIALHGMNDYGNAFDAAGKSWAGQGITTLAYDQRGFGRGPDPGSWAGDDLLRDDFRDFVAATRAHYPGVPLFALGESMGGAVVMTTLAQPAPPDLAGIILVSPAVWSRDDMPMSYRVALFLAAHLMPGLTLSGSGLKIVVSDNIPMLRALSRDPYVIKQTKVAAVHGLVNLMDEARQAPAHLPATPPILLLHGKNDPIIPSAPAEAVIAALGSRATVKEYPKGYHMLLRDLDGGQVQQDVVDWVAQRLR